VSGLTDVVVLAGPNGVGKSRLIGSILAHLRKLSGTDIALQIEATISSEEKVWGKKAIDTANPADRQLLKSLLQKKQARRKFQSSVLNFDSNRSIQRIEPYAFSWDVTDPWDEQIGWETTWSTLRNRFQDTLHAIFRKVHSLESDIARKARMLQQSRMCWIRPFGALISSCCATETLLLGVRQSPMLKRSRRENSVCSPSIILRISSWMRRR